LEYSQAFELMFKQARDDGLLVVVSAGNTNTDIDGTNPVRFPQAFSFNNLVVVMGIDQTGAKWTSSSYGTTSVDIAAPSVNIRAFDNLRVTPAVPYYAAGTSFAAPMVAATCALIWEQHPTWTYLQVINHLYATGKFDSGLTSYCATSKLVNLAQAVGVSCPNCRPQNCLGECP